MWMELSCMPFQNLSNSLCATDVTYSSHRIYFWKWSRSIAFNQFSVISVCSDRNSGTKSQKSGIKNKENQGFDIGVVFEKSITAQRHRNL